MSSDRSRLLDQIAWRDNIQNAIAKLIAGYEATSGVRVVALNYEHHDKRVTIEGLPF